MLTNLNFISYSRGNLSLMIDHHRAHSGPTFQVFYCHGNQKVSSGKLYSIFRKVGTGIYVGPPAAEGTIRTLACLDRIVMFADEEPDMPPCFGVADNVQQVLEHGKRYIDSSNYYFLLLSPVKKSTEKRKAASPITEDLGRQPLWKWSDWGPYIGKQRVKAPILGLEDEIRRVVVFRFLPARKKEIHA